MKRIFVSAVAILALPALLIGTLGSGAAQASPVLPGTVTCNAASGVWTGTIRFKPALRNGGTAPKETMQIAAGLGNSASPCITTSGTVEAGKITGKLKFALPAANDCATVFSGSALPPPVGGASKFKLTWGNPPGAPTNWKHPPPFSVTGAAGMTNISVTGGKVTGSFSPYLTPNASFSDTGWPTTIAAACASSSGLSSLTLGTSGGTW
jgi:hypothetical protein